VGAWIAGALFKAGLPPGALMQIAAALLFVHLLLYRVILARPDGRPAKQDLERKANAPILGGLALVFRSRYISLIALLLVLLNLVNTTGEYLLSSFAEKSAEAALAAAAASTPDLDANAFLSQYFGLFYGNFFFWVNVSGVVLQALVASRIVKYLGVGGLLFALPIVALGNYAWIAMGLGLGAFRFLKTAENATDYSIMNTAKATLWLPTTHEEKFQAKQAVDTFFVRVGDVLAAALVFVGTQQLTLGVEGFARVNVVVIFVWMTVTALVFQMYRRRATSE